MALQKKYRNIGETPIASYNYTDVAEGTGVIAFYGGGIATSGAVEYRLDSRQFDPWHHVRLNGDETNSGRYAIAISSSSSYTKIHDLDFKTSAFNLPRTLNGTMHCQIPFAFDPQLSTDDLRLYAVANVIRLRDAVETQIATGTSEPQSTAVTSATVTDGMISFIVTIPKTKFKKNDILQVTLEIWAQRFAGSGSHAVLIVTDPLARDVAAAPGGTDPIDEVRYTGGRPLIFYIPFDLDL